METKKVLFIAAPFKRYFLVEMPGWLQGGAELKHALPDVNYTLREFANKGYEVHITLPVFGNMYRVGKFIREGKIHVHNYRLPFFFLPLVKVLTRKGNFILDYVFAFLTLAFSFDYHRRLINRLQPVFIYQMGPNLVLGEYLRRASGLPLIYRLFGTTLTPFLKPSGFPIPFRIALRHGIEVFIYKHIASLYVQSNDGSGGGKTMDRFGVPKERQFFVVNGINVNEQEKAIINIKEGLPKDAFVAVTAARLVKWKGLDRVIRALPKAIELNPKLYYVIIGEGPMQAELEKLSKSLGVAGHVRFVGAVPNVTIIDTMRKADVFISTIYRPQNLPNCMLEAIAAGCNIVSLADGSLEGFLEDGKNAILLNPTKVEEDLPYALENLANNKNLFKRLRTAVEEKRRGLWSWQERIAREIEKIEFSIKN